ncbi:MAG: hypothetical protein QM504_12785 [Pseudomonadota bacterium]
MEPLNSPTCMKIGQELSNFDNASVVKIASGLLTIPELSANSVRLETLVHLSLIYAQGSKVPTRILLKRILNESMGSSMIAMMEDPIEDVFVLNIQTSHGDCLVFNGLWEGNDYFIQTLIDLVDRSPVPQVMRSARDCCLALIRLSNEVTKRANLNRNVFSESSPKQEMKVPSSSLATSIGNRVTFTQENLASVGINIDDLAPFIISEQEIKRLGSEIIGNSTLERKPIVSIGESYIVALPSAIGISIRKFFLEECQSEGLINAFQTVLAKYQSFQLKSEILREFKGKAKSIKQDVEKTSNLPHITSLLLKDRSEKYYHFLIIHDDLEELIEQGFDSIHSLEKGNEEAIYSFIVKTSEFCKKQDGFQEGTTVCLHGGLGRGFGLGFEVWPDNWGFVAISLADLSLLGIVGGAPLEELVYCSKQSRWMQDNGIHISNINGDINFYGFWKDNNYECCPSDISLDSNNHITLGTNYLFTVRKDLRIISDKHCSIDTAGNWVRCERLTKDSYFEGMKSLPLYGCVDHFDEGYLNGLIKLNFVNIWFGISLLSPNIERAAIYEWWSGFMNLLCECLLFIDSKVNTICAKPIQINLDLHSLVAASKIKFESKEYRDISIHIDANIITLKFESNFLANFGQVENYGEQKVIYTMLSTIGRVLVNEGLDINEKITQAIDFVMSDSGVRIIHLYKTFDPTENTLMKTAVKPIFVFQPEVVFDGLLISKSIGYKDKVLSNTKDCGKYLHLRVDLIWVKIKRILNNINKSSLLIDLTENINSIEQDRQQWKRTAKAVQAIHQKHDDVTHVAGSIESQRSLASLCCRTLIEMSVCECPVDGGGSSNKAKLNSLMSLTALLVNTASDSDAINSALVEPLIEIQPNGSYRIPTDIWNSVLQPYYAGYFEFQFIKSVKSYAELYTVKEPKQSNPDSIFHPDFAAAFESEFEFTPTEYIECIAEIIDQIILSNDEYIIINKDELIDKIHTQRNIPKITVLKFIGCFSLFNRKGWDNLPEGYVFRDIAPWKHKRKLSCLVRPLIEVDNNELFCSLSLIKTSSMYFIDKTSEGEFIPEFYNSQKMRSFVGKMIDKRGADYTNTVKKYFEEQGWQAESEVLMPTLGAPQKLGDIDVLLLSNDGRLIAIECKNLQMAKTISEVADVLNRFKGHGDDDELLKHLKRIEWVSENLNQVKERVAFKGEVSSFEHYLLTNTEMPMQYASGLPIDARLIKSYKNIKEIIEGSI